MRDRCKSVVGRGVSAGKFPDRGKARVRLCGCHEACMAMTAAAMRNASVTSPATAAAIVDQKVSRSCRLRRKWTNNTNAAASESTPATQKIESSELRKPDGRSAIIRTGQIASATPKENFCVRVKDGIPFASIEAGTYIWMRCSAQRGGWIACKDFTRRLNSAPNGR